MDGPDKARLRQQFNAMFDAVFDAGRLAERNATSSVLRDVLAKLGQNADRVDVPEPRHTEDAAGPAVPIQNRARRGKRAPSGSVRQSVRSILRDSPVPLGPFAVVEIAKDRGEALKQSSVRMALIGLSQSGEAIQVGRGEWRYVRRPPHDGFFPPTAAPVGAVQGGESHPGAEGETNE